jgi:hypothetical protein
MSLLGEGFSNNAKKDPQLQEVFLYEKSQSVVDRLRLFLENWKQACK